MMLSRIKAHLMRCVWWYIDMRKLESLTKKQLIDEVETRVKRARDEFFESGWECGFRDCIIRMLDSGTNPRFIAKIARVDLQYILKLINPSEND